MNAEKAQVICGFDVISGIIHESYGNVSCSRVLFEPSKKSGLGFTKPRSELLIISENKSCNSGKLLRKLLLILSWFVAIKVDALVILAREKSNHLETPVEVSREPIINKRIN